MAQGIDVSKWQGTVDWAAVKGAGKAFGIARSSIGKSTADPTFIANYKGIVKNGLIPGAYHLVTATSTGPEQAANWKTQLDAAGFDKGILALDVEGWTETLSNPPSDTLAVVQYLCNWIRDTYNRTPVIYTGAFWRDYLKQHPNNFGSELWLAAYVTDPTSYIPTAWTTWKIWQYSSSGSVNGVTGSTDLDKSAGTLYSLQTLAGWEWDELATQAEIRTIVAEEVTKAATDVKNNDNGNFTALSDGLTNALDVLMAHSTTNNMAINTANNAILNVGNTLTAKLNELELVVQNTDNADEIATLAASLELLKAAVDALHAHVCKRVDLHR